MDNHDNQTWRGHMISDINDTVQFYINIYLMCVGCTLIGALGVVANIINFIVLNEQGFFKDCVSLCLLTLTFADFSTALLTVVYSACYVLSTNGVVYYLDPISLMFMISWIRGMTFDISMLTTAFISFERCCSVLMPLKFKTLTFRRALIFLSGIHIFVLTAYSLPYSTQGLSPQWDPSNNSTRILLWLSTNRAQVEFIVTTAFHMLNGTVCEFIVFGSTLGMIHGLQKSSQFRLSRSSSGLEKDKSFSSKNKSIVKMVSILAAIFIFCNMFRLLLLYLRRFIPEISFGRRLENVYNTLIGINFFFGTLNSSVNIFVYYSLKPSFKAILLSTFCKPKEAPAEGSTLNTLNKKVTKSGKMNNKLTRS